MTKNMVKKMEELRHGQTCEACQYIITLDNCEQIRMFLDAEKVSTVINFMANHVTGIKEAVQYSYEDIKVI